MADAPTPAPRLHAVSLVVGLGYLCLLVLALVAHSTDPRLWTWTAAYACAGAVTAVVLGGLVPHARPWPVLTTSLLVLTLALAAAVAVVGGMGGLALAVSASPVVGLWIGERRGR